MKVADQVTALTPSRPLQLAGGGSGGDSSAVRTRAAEGVSGSAGTLPHLAAIQHSFGPHDVSGVRAHVGSGAAAAAKDIGARAYAMGNDVAFAETPSLHTAAHEAAHVVQQRAGVSLPGGVGSVGDRYERQADAIADRVVQGKSAQDLLSAAAGQDAAARAVQMRAVQFEDEAPTKAEMVEFIAGLVANPKDSSLRQTYETGVAALATRAEQGVAALGIALDAYRAAAQSKGAVHLSEADDAKLAPLAQELNQARLQLSTDAKMLTLRPLLLFIFELNTARYQNPYGPTYEFLRASGKTNAQCVGGACRPNPDINSFLGNFKTWLAGLADERVAEYYQDAKSNRLGP